MRILSVARRARSILTIIIAATAILAGVAAANAHTTPSACAVTASKRPAPGGNGAAYRHIPGGVYGWVVHAKEPFMIYTEGRWHKYHGWVYAGSSKQLKIRLGQWLRSSTIKKLVSKGNTFSFRVLVRDWDTKKWELPKGLTLNQVRLGAEQFAILVFAKWGVKNGFYPLNKVNAISRDKPWRMQAIAAGKLLMRHQVENNAPAGVLVGSGDITNYGTENMPIGAYNGVAGGDPSNHYAPITARRMCQMTEMLVYFDEEPDAKEFRGFLAWELPGCSTQIEPPDEFVQMFVLKVRAPWDSYASGEEELEKLAGRFESSGRIFYGIIDH